ncbi:MAG: trigger factor, partial [Dehalococcoidia bacterium]
VKATVPIRPTIELGDYRALRVEPQPVEVDAAKVDEALENLRERYATVEPVERSIEDGDVIRADVLATAEGRELVNQEDVELTVTEDGLRGLPGLYSTLLGLAAGAHETAEAIAPEETGEELAGKTIAYDITVKDVKARVLPELDDEFAKEVGESFPTLAALRERVESDLRERLQTEADQKLEEDALAKLVEQSTVEFPPQLIEREVEHMLRDQGVPGDDRRTFERMLQRAGVNEEDLRAQFRPVAGERVKRTLILAKLRELENLSVTPEEVNEELDRISSGGPQGEQLRQIFDTESGREAIERSLVSRRTVERLRQIALGEAPEPAAAAEAVAADASVADTERDTVEPEPTGEAPEQAEPRAEEPETPTATTE